jgi:diguanylate cyclase (GGDEF)-like protein
MVDVRTLLLVTALLSMFVGATLLLVIRDHPPGLRAGMGRWARAMLAQGAGLLLVVAFGHGAPGWLALPLGNALLVASQAWVVHALVRFGGTSRAPLWVFALVPVTWAAGLWLTVVQPDPALRTAVTTFGYDVGLVLALGLVWRLSRREAGIGLRLLGAVMLVGLVVISVRALLQFTGRVDVHPFAPTLLQMGFPLYALAICVLGGFAFQLMCYERFTRQLLEQASTDPLTDVFNRRALFRIAQAAIADARREGRRIGVLLIDVDHFKRVNDRHGHEAGDEVLRVLVRRMQGELRAADVLGRVGGEEFVVLLRFADPATLAEIGERLLQGVRRRPIEVGDFALPATISIGATLLAAGDLGLRDLLRRADAAVYAAKAAGRDRLVVDPGPGADADGECVGGKDPAPARSI